jgi:hypothetical protein
MNKAIILNLAWAGVAGAAFYTGWQMKNAGDSEATTKSKIRPVMESASAGAGNTGSKGVSPLLVSKSDGVLDFYKRYGLDTGTPLTPEKMKEAMQEAIRESDPVKSQMMFARLMEELTAENAPAALAMIRENVGGMESMRFMGMLAYKWGEVDPTKAMEELGKGGGRESGFSRNFVLSGWAAKDPQGAIAWLDSYEGDGKEWMSMSLVNGLARSDVDAAMKYAANIKDDGERARAAESIAREMLRAGGAEKATAWLSSITDPEMKRGAFQTVAEQIMRGDATKAEAFIRQYANEDYASGAVGNLAENKARTDVKAGLEFANSLTGKAQARAVGEVVNEWLNKDDGAQAVEASKYVESLPVGDTRDAGARAIAREIVRDDPQGAIAWANAIADNEVKQETLIDVGRRYMREDPTAAAAWLQQSGLSAEAQQQVTAPPGRGDWGRGGGGPPGGLGGRGGRGR